MAYLLQLQEVSQVRVHFALVCVTNLLYSHAAHHLLCIWAMGANGPLIDAAYATHCKYQRPAFESPGHISHGNYNKHLGDERYVITHSFDSVWPD